MGYPSRVSRKGKAGPLEAGRGKHSPPASPERVTPEVLKRRDNGFPFISTFSERKERVFSRRQARGWRLRGEWRIENEEVRRVEAEGKISNFRVQIQRIPNAK